MIMAKKRMKRGNGRKGDREPGTILEDRISALPDEVIHHILSFLPTSVAIRTSLLSKEWRHKWTLVPVLDFCDSRDVHDFRRQGEINTEYKRFLKFVDECLKCHYRDAAIFKFKLDMELGGCSGRLESWLHFAIQKNVEELELRVRTIRAPYSVPSPILQLSSLTLLRFHDLVLDTVSPASLPSLKQLSLFDVGVTDQVLNNLLLGCPSLEKLCLNYCYGLRDPEVSSLSLKYMEFRPGGIVCLRRSIKVEAINLRSFVYDGTRGSGSRCSINLVGCWAIRILSFNNAFLADHWFEDLIPQLPQLETLHLANCYGVRNIQIWNQHLKNFLFTHDYRFDSLMVAINTPKLVYFRYTGHSMFNISVTAPNMLDANIELSDYLRKTCDNEWHANLIKFLSKFNGCKSVHMSTSSAEALIIPDELRATHRPPLPDLKCFKVKAGYVAPQMKEMFTSSLLWIAPSSETWPIEEFEEVETCFSMNS